MSQGILDVYVIETPFSQRSAPLIKQLLSDDRINLIKIPAKIVTCDRDISDFGIKVNREVFMLIEGRNLSYGEIGCAQSHNDARSLLAKSKKGGVILEDDARIIELDSFIKISNNFLNQHRYSKRILSLTGVSQIYKMNEKKFKSPAIEWVRYYGNTPLAVANVITSMAARNLCHYNQPIKYVADWPYSKSKFYLVKKPIVCHGDETTESIINVSGNRERTTKVNLKFYIFSFSRFLITRNKQLGIIQYLNWVVFLRISDKLNKLIYKINNIGK